MTAIARTRPLKTRLQIVDQGAHQVSEEDGEEKCDERSPRHVKKAQTQRKQQRRDQDPRRI